MRPQDFREHLRTQPFRPFRVTLTDGRTYEVLHPELAMVGHSTVAIGLARPNAAEPVFDRLVTVSLLHIMQIEPIVPASS
jgi:hypothetical protein